LEDKISERKRREYRGIVRKEEKGEKEEGKRGLFQPTTKGWNRK